MNKRLEPEPNVLYIVGTPIGNLGDLSPRARNLLNEVSIIACEDTRHSGILLKVLKIKTTLISFHKYNFQSRIPKLLQLLKDGNSIALISDAGLPGVSDPGEILVAEAKKSGIEVICIPGPCAALTALVSSGIPSERFCFEGFLPKNKSDRKARLETIAQEPRTTIIYESPHRLIQLLNELMKVCGANRPLEVGRELTKIHEEHIGRSVGSVLQHFLKNKPIGECTLILGGEKLHDQIEYSNDQLREKMEILIKDGKSVSEAARDIAKKTNNSRRFLYALLHKEGSRNDVLN